MTESGERRVREVRLVNRRGLHARASARLVRAAEQFRAAITVEKDELAVCATSIMGLMLLAAACGDTVRLVAQGPDAEDALNALTRLISDRFEEGE